MSILRRKEWKMEENGLIIMDFKDIEKREMYIEKEGRRKEDDKFIKLD